MQKSQRAPKHESSEEYYDEPDFYNSEHTGQCLPCLERFFLAIEAEEKCEIAQALEFLSTELSMNEEQVLATQPLDKALSLLLECLEMQDPEISLQSMTCVNLILDTLPELSEVIIDCGGIERICEKINPLDFFDLTEQAVRALEKISLEYPLEALEGRAIESVIAIIDYFDGEVQKKVLNIICNCVRAIQSLDIVDQQVLPVIPSMLGIIHNKGGLEFRVEKVLEFLSIVIESIIMIIPHKGDAFKPYSKLIVEYGVVRILVEMFPSNSEYVLKILVDLCERSSIVVKSFFSIGGFEIIKAGVLQSPEIKNTNFTGILDLLDTLVPKVPATESWNKEKVEFYSTHPEYIQALCELILPRTKSISENFLSKEDKVIMISILEKILKIANIESVSHYITCQSFSTFLSEIMISKDLYTVRAALRISLFLYEKIPQKISVNFAREGVIARVSTLKDADRLKEFKKLPKRRLGIEDLLYRGSDTKNPYQLENMLSNIKSKVNKPATIEDYKKELISYSKKILEKHKIFENKKAPRIGKEIRMIAQKLLSYFGETAQDLLQKVTALLNSKERLSYYEISNSLIAEALWKWLAESTTEKLLLRLTEFLKIFTKESVYGETFFSLLIKSLIGTANFVQHFRIILHDSKALSAKRSHKVKISFEYFGQTDEEGLAHDHEYLTRHQLFLTHKKIQLNTCQLITFEKLKELLLRISNESDLYTLVQQKIISETTVHMFLDRPYPRDLQIAVYHGGKELKRGTTILNAVSKKSSVGLRFRFTRRPTVENQFKYLSSAQEILEYIIQESSHTGLDPKDKSYNYFRLVKFLFHISEYLPFLHYLLGVPGQESLPASSFSCTKLSALLSRQLQDLLSIEGNIPAQWVKNLPVKCHFLFSVISRYEFMDAFGLASISKIEKKHKCIVNRANLLEDAIEIMRDTGLCIETILEIEYENEVGTGIGPTIEFFTLVSNEIKNLKIWRNMCEGSGLFPSPISESDKRWDELFEFIGRFIGKAIIDRRHLDFQLSPALWKLIFVKPLSITDMQDIDMNIGKHLLAFSINPLEVESSYLVFTLPGYPEIEIKPNGKNILVTAENVEEYIYLSSIISLKQDQQAKAIRKGMDSIIPTKVLSIFYYTELEDILYGEDSSSWDIELLKLHVIPLHGYNSSSKTYINLLLMLSSIESSLRKHFLEFVTGFPRLPLGGFEKLAPKLTVVKKDTDWPDSCLPSVMTCQNYLKLPDYSNYETLEKNLLYAIKEGRQAFHLS